MTIANSGAVSLLDVQNEFGGSAPISMSEYVSTLHGGPLSNAGTFHWLSNSLNGMHGRKNGGYEALTGSGAWTIPNGTVVMHIYVIGGGGGGALFFSFSSGFGGGSGGYYWPFSFAPWGSGEYAIGSAVSWSVGAGGAGAGPNNGSPGAGSNFGTGLVVTGGGGGVYGTAGGAGGSPNGVSGNSTPPGGGDPGFGHGYGGQGAPVFGSGSPGGNGALYIRWQS